MNVVTFDDRDSERGLRTHGHVEIAIKLVFEFDIRSIVTVEGRLYSKPFRFL